MLRYIKKTEKLCREDQNILRTASIIGDTFSTDILYGVLPPKLRVKMFHSVDNLVRNQWIIEVPDDIGKFKFVHPLFYQTLYDVTPASEKARLHYSIACYIEDKFDKQPTYYAQLGHQYGLAKDCRPKALEYFVRAAVYCMNSGPMYYEEGLELLIQAKIFTETATDYGIILSIILFNRNKLQCLRMKLIEDEEKDSYFTASDNNLPSRSKSFFNWNFPNFQKITPMGSPSNIPSTATSIRQSRDSTKSKLSTFKTDEQGLTVNGADIFLNFFRQVEEEINILYLDMMKNNLLGVPLEWQRIINDEMKGESKKQDEIYNIHDKKEYSKRHRGNVLILAAGSIKMISNAVNGNGRKSSLLDLLSRSNSIAPSTNRVISNNVIDVSTSSVKGVHSKKKETETEIDKDKDKDKDKCQYENKMNLEDEDIDDAEEERQGEHVKENILIRNGKEKNKTDMILGERNVLECEKIVNTDIKPFIHSINSSKQSGKSEKKQDNGEGRGNEHQEENIQCSAPVTQSENTVSKSEEKIKSRRFCLC